MKVYENYKDFPMDKWRWPNFSPREMACRGDGKLAIDEDAMDCLQRLRDLLNRPLIVNSAYRSPEYNAKIGGAKGSQHKLAKAFDISMANQEPLVFERAARTVGFTGFGFYRKNNFMHIDIGPKREWGARWWDFDEANNLPVEQPLRPETASEDRDLLGALTGGAGAVSGGGAILSGLGNLSPVAQVVALAGVSVAILAALYILRNRIRELAR